MKIYGTMLSNLLDSILLYKNEADVNGLASIICCAIEDVNVDES